jgi:TolB-like protein/Tfp pilus assembly protein PilF
MIYRLGDMRLDTDRAELSGADGPVALEPKAYDLLLLLLAHEGRVVSREEVIETVWGGRFVSDAAVSTVLKGLRRALGDDGEAQRVIRTVRGRGYRLVAEVSRPAPDPIPARPIPPHAESAPNADPPATQVTLADTRPKLAILPFRRLSWSGEFGVIADAVSADLIAGLSRLRWLQVVAQESSFRLRGEEIDLGAVRDRLGATYALSGTLEVDGRRLRMSVSLSDLRTNAVIWSDQFPGSLDDVHQMRSAIAAAVLASLEFQIPLNEAMRARSQPSELLDAWGAYHLGLQHVFRFTRNDNAMAAGYFERATRLDPHFASAFAGLSFTSYQSASMRYSPDRDGAIAQARAQAERSLELDPLDPFANLSEGRLFLLLGRPEDGRPWLDRSVQLIPSYAKAYYSRGFAAMLAGRTEDCLADMDRAIELSPLDPVLCAMQSCKGVAHLAAGRHDEAVEWANRGARAPGAHIAMLLTAVAAAQLAGDGAGVRAWREAVDLRYPGATLRQFLTVLPFADAGLRRLLANALSAAGLPA